MTPLDPQQRRRRDIALAVVVGAYILSFFQRFAPAGIAPDLAAAFDTSAASLGALAATYFYVYTLMQLPTGILADTLGPRRILVAGGIVASAGSLIFALAPDLTAALVGRTLIGLGVSVTFIAMLKIIALWYDERRFATMVGLCMLVGNLGSILAGAPLSWLAQNAGWRGVFVGSAVLSAVFALACGLLVRDSPNSAAAPRARFDRTAILSALGAVLKNRDTWPAIAVNAGLSGSFFAFAGLWATPFLTQAHGLSREAATTHASLYFAGFALGCVLIGSISDRIGRRRPALIGASHVYVASWALLLSGASLPPSLSYALFALMGLSTAAFTLTWACAKEVNPPLLSGMSTAVVNMGGFLTGALLQPAVGWVMDRRWDGTLTAAGARLYSPEDYRAGLLLLGIAAFCGAAAAWWIRETGCRNIWRAGAANA
jgi:predicted MFS family arabinose efflux permease